MEAEQQSGSKRHIVTYSNHDTGLSDDSGDDEDIADQLEQQVDLLTSGNANLEAERDRLEQEMDLLMSKYRDLESERSRLIADKVGL